VSVVDELMVEPAPDQRVDPFLYRLLVGGLVAAILLVIGGAIALAWAGKVLPDGIIALGGAAVGGLVGLLVPSPTN
jgi:hypothetical protein